RGPDRARLAHVVRAVALGAAGKVVALDGAGEALALAAPADLDRVARLARLDSDRLTDVEALGVAELDQMAMRCHAGVLQMPDLGLAELALLYLAEGQLQRRVAVAVGRAHLRAPLVGG